jgi:LysM repeat protein
MIDSNGDSGYQDPSPDRLKPPDPQQSDPVPGTGRFEAFWQQLTSMGLADSALRLGTHLLSILAVIIVVWAAREFYRMAQPVESAQPEQGVQAAEIPSPTSTPSPPDLPPLPVLPVYARPGVLRQVDLHTTVPSRPRLEPIQYTVQPGDTVFDVAEKFGLKPETILWGNYSVLNDDPHNLQPAQVLTILPVDGTYYEWQPGDGLNSVARFFGVTPEDIINWPSNKLDPAIIGDYAKPNIQAGTWLVVPGGHREFVSWSAPRITRENPGVAKILGPGNCGPISDGPIGVGSFVWPADHHFLSGFDYVPGANHFGIDIDGDLGNPVYAVDSGVVVYAGWNDWGYGNVIVIDHGNGWQSLYAHLNALNVGCGSYAYHGDVIGAFGSTGNSSGPHLHFELMSDLYGKVNPWNFLP